MYKVPAYGRMIDDSVRTDAYAEALKQNVKMGDTVLDLGAGLGILSFLAVQCGAAKVYAVDPNPVLNVARELASANGMDNKIEFIQDASDNLQLDQKVDGIVSDLRLSPNEASLILDSRDRLLKPGGWQIPMRDEAWMCLIESPVLYWNVMRPWRSGRYGVDMTAASRWACNAIHDYWPIENEKLGEAQSLGHMDFTRNTDPVFKTKAEWTAETGLKAHGAIVWFDAILTSDVSFSTRPTLPKGESSTIYGSRFLAFEEPVPIEAGQEISFHYSTSSGVFDEKCHWSIETGGSSGRSLSHSTSPNYSLKDG